VNGVFQGLSIIIYVDLDLFEPYLVRLVRLVRLVIAVHGISPQLMYASNTAQRAHRVHYISTATKYNSSKV
jgi:hypothetical protein